MYIDTHCHLDNLTEKEIENNIKSIKDNYIIVSGYDDKSNLQVVDLVNKYKNVFGTIGIHPSEVSKSNIKIIEENINNPKIVGIGEIGLDYHYGKEEELIQKDYFQKQINIARKINKPVVIHSRDASLDTIEIIKKNIDVSYIMHCYSYSLETALELIKISKIKFGIGGVVTFKNAKEIKRVVKEIPLSYILLETDSPYLTPEPYRGEKNKPENVQIVAKKIAEIKEIPYEIVLNETSNNAISQFDLNI